ncbi:MAG: response regulator [Acidobacteriaceae bacterium]
MPKPLILCVDDEDLGLQIRKAVLERSGYRVVVAPDGPTGLDIFAKAPVGLVILDYFMPNMDGGLVAAQMRNLRPTVPIILLSAYINLPSEINRIVDSTILKGDGPETLLSKIRELLPPSA